MPQVEAINMIILNSKNFKSQMNQSEILQFYKKTVDFYDLECPHCKSDELIKWTSYKRKVYYLENKTLKSEIIEIKRVKCNQCGKTHALLPECIVPYKQALLKVILLTIQEDDISYDFPFSYETVCNWKRSFKNLFLPYLKTMFWNKKEIIPEIFRNLFQVYEEFYKKNKAILMMTHVGIYNMAYF